VYFGGWAKARNCSLAGPPVVLAATTATNYASESGLQDLKRRWPTKWKNHGLRNYPETAAGKRGTREMPIILWPQLNAQPPLTSLHRQLNAFSAPPSLRK
jgi:hypothetical protein